MAKIKTAKPAKSNKTTVFVLTSGPTDGSFPSRVRTYKTREAARKKALNAYLDNGGMEERITDPDYLDDGYTFWSIARSRV